MQKFAVANLGLALALLAHPLAAAEYCVVCAGPEATYRCQVDGAGARDQDPRTQLLCISQLANAGKHDSCSISRRPEGSQVGEACPGEIRIIAAPAHSEPQPAVAPHEPTDDVPGPPAETVGEIPHSDEQSPNKVPETVEELAGQTVKSSKEGLAKASKVIGGTGEAIASGAKETGEKIGAAGSAVGAAAKKTWDCLTSLFKDC